MTNHRNDLNKEVNPGETGNLGHTTSQHNPTAPQGLKRRHFMGTALALDAAALLAACGGGGGGGDAAGSGSGSGSGSSSGSTSSSASGSGSGSGSSSGSGSGSGSAAPTNWVVSTLAGTGGISPVTEGTGGTATFNFPYGVAVDTSGNVYVADQNNHRIRKITSAGVVSTFAGTVSTGATDGTGGTARFYYPTAVAVDSSGNVYVADQSNHLIRKISTVGVVSTFAGIARAPGSANGTGLTASFNLPTGIAVDSSDHVYVADNNNHMIRKISPNGEVSTLAGTGSIGADNGTGETASFYKPSGVAVDPSGNVYVADQYNLRVRKITSLRLVSTLAGSGALGADNGAGATARFSYLSGVAVDTSGNVYVADYTNNLIRRISSLGEVGTLAGTGASGTDDGTGATAKFHHPYSVAVDISGNVFVADTDNHRIRKITPIYP